jgi:hypothetical protein
MFTWNGESSICALGFGLLEYNFPVRLTDALVCFNKLNTQAKPTNGSNRRE